MIGHILLIGEIDFPAFKASSIRVFGIAKTLQMIGYSPIIVGRGELDSISTDSFNLTYEGILYNSLQSESIKHLNYKKQYIYMLDEYNKRFQLNKVLLYASSSARFYTVVNEWCSKHNVELILDLSENYSQKQFKHGYFDKNYWSFRLNYNYKIRKHRKVITCSDYMASFFDDNSTKTYTLNAVMDLQNRSKLTKNDQKVVITYAGDAGKKDELLLILKSVHLLDSLNKSKICIKLIGPSEQVINTLLKPLNVTVDQLSWLTVTGRVTRERVLSELETSDFTILLRPSEVYSNSGFPSKVAESMSVGVPVITNNTSDLTKYVINEVSGYLIRDLSVQSIQNTISHAINITSDEYDNMQEKCILLAQVFKPQVLSNDVNFRRFLNE